MENTRKRYNPRNGKAYKLHSTRRGGESIYICTGAVGDGCAVMQNTKSGWQLFAHGIGIYPDGTIDWDYSTGGRFVTPLPVPAQGEALFL